MADVYASLYSTSDSAMPVKGYSVFPTSSLTLDTSAYSEGYVFSDKVEWTNVIRQSEDITAIHTVTIIDDDEQNMAFDLVFFNADFTAGTKNTAWAVNMSDCLGYIPIASSDYANFSGSSVASLKNVGLILHSTGSSIFMGTMSRGTGSFTATGVKVKLGMYQD